MKLIKTVNYSKSHRVGDKTLHPVERVQLCRVKHIRSYYKAINPPRAQISTSMKWEE